MVAECRSNSLLAVVSLASHVINTLGKIANFRINSQFCSLYHLQCERRMLPDAKTGPGIQKTATLVVHGFTDKRSALFIVIFKWYKKTNRWADMLFAAGFPDDRHYWWRRKMAGGSSSPPLSPSLLHSFGPVMVDKASGTKVTSCLTVALSAWQQ